MELTSGDVAVVTGAASGIGRSLAAHLASDGLTVVLADVDAAALEEATATIGGDTHAVATDVALAGEVERLAATVWERFGQVQLLCNNAGVFQGGLVWEVDPAGWDWVLGVNVRGLINGIRAFVPRMLTQPGPSHVLNTASMASHFVAPFSGPYCVSKFAAYALTEALAQDLRAVGARVTASVLCPSAVATGIAGSRRHRREAAPPSEAERFVEEALAETTAGGLDPDEAAAIALASVRAGDFLVPTRASYAAQIRGHAEALLDRRLPDLPEID
jgi:NAD(P)-dependent dehydrogenase (short-subunit alcohol dehydrogenase family)